MSLPEQWPNHSTDVWDYIPKRLPSRQDRDRLVQRAQEAPREAKRVKIWDFFFRFNPEEIGGPIRKEIAQLESELPKVQHASAQRQAHKREDIARIQQQMASIPTEIEQHLQRSMGKIRQSYLGRMSRRQIFGVVLTIACVLGVLGTLFLMYLFFQGQQSFVGGASNVALCCLPMILIVGVLAFFSFQKAQQNRQALDEELTRERERAYQARDQREAQLRQQIHHIEQEIHQINLQTQHTVERITARQQELHTLLNSLMKQIPWPPSPQEVYQWLIEDLNDLGELAKEESRLDEGKLQKILGVDNPICIRGPAILQEKSVIPEHYRKAKTDLNKHFTARRYEAVASEKFADFYGMYSIQFLLLGTEVLANYGLLYNFITGRAVEVRTRRQHYADIVGIETRRSNLEVQGEDESFLVEGVPSLRVSLTNDERIDITYPNDDYYRQVAGRSFVAGQLEYDPRKAADNANRCIHENVREAKQRLERSRYDELRT
jgi:predicted PurR-regulated permease PerM